MTCSELAQIIAAIATVATALIALITTKLNHQYNKRIEIEKHEAVKPKFIINTCMMNGIDNVLQFRVTNFGFDKYQKISAVWEGLDNVEVTINYIFNKKEQDNTDFVIKVNLGSRGLNSGEINCILKLIYSNIYGKKYTESIDVVIIKKDNEDISLNFPYLKESFVNKEFV